MSVADGAANDHAVAWGHFPSSQYHKRNDADMEALIDKMLKFSNGINADENEIADLKKSLMRVDAGNRYSRQRMLLARRALNKLSFRKFAVSRNNGTYVIKGWGGYILLDWLPSHVGRGSQRMIPLELFSPPNPFHT